MGYKALTKCPVCNSKLTITKLKCKRCDTTVENEFEFSKFAYLSKEQLGFIEVFLKSRGNIKDVEKALGISYPTVRAKLDDVIGALGNNDEKKSLSDTQKVLDMLENGEITAEQAVKLLKS